MLSAFEYFIVLAPYKFFISIIIISYKIGVKYLFCLFHLSLSGELIFRTLQQILLEARIESSKTELSKALKRTALEKGFAISDNQGEGNCMFFALSEQLDLVKGIQISHDELRRTVVQHLQENPRLVSILLPYYLIRVNTFAVYAHSCRICPLNCFNSS